MTQPDCAGSLQVCVMRLAKLDPTGVPMPGAGNLYVTDALIKLESKTILREGDDFEQPNGCGAVCVTYKDCDRLKRLDLSMELCTPDPQLKQMIAGGTLFDSNRGYAFPEVGLATCPYGVSIEAWTKAVVNGTQASDYPWFRWVFPRTIWNAPGDFSLENAITGNVLTGHAEENPNWYNGPANDWPYASARICQYHRETTIPATSCGAQTLVAS